MDIERDVVFSLQDGFVWAGWPGKSTSVELGRCSDVVEVMRDFLAQCELGVRLANPKAVNDQSPAPTQSRHEQAALGAPSAAGVLDLGALG
jgi:hypothetical protein